MVLSELIDKGGIVMIIIILLSIYVGTVILYKCYQFIRLQAFTGTLIQDVMAAVADRQYQEALRLVHKNPKPMAKVIDVALRTWLNRSLDEDKKLRHVEAVGSHQIRQFETHLKGLELAANIAPLLGLLGTVTGMVGAFAGIGEGGAQVDPSILASGIWEALLTTVGGLCVAIPALAAYYIIDARIEQTRAKLKEVVLYIFSRSEENISG